MLLPLIVALPFAGGLLSYLIGRRSENGRDMFVCVLTALEMVLVCLLPSTLPSFEIRNVLSSGLSFTTDGFRSAYAILTALMWLGTTLFAMEYFRHERENLNRYWFFVIVTLGATEGVMLSADFMTAFTFFEILSFTSFTWVIQEETKEAIDAGFTYLFVAVIGGLILFMGLLLLQHATGTLNFAELRALLAPSEGQMAAALTDGTISRGEIYAAGVCILLGFGAKAGMFPLHIWLPKAHPVAPSPASALLSGILTKVGIYGILMTAVNVLSFDRRFGILVLVLGEITMFLGALLALFSVNLKRTLACSSMSQIGFILTGTAMYVLLTAAGHEEAAAETALSGLMLHMVNHSLIKLTLFMAAGVVVMNIHTLTLDDIRGWGRNKLPLKIAFALGALGISGVPLMNGYISKTLLHEGIVEGTELLAGMGAGLKCAEWIFLISGGFTFAYMLKLFICIFIEKNNDEARQAAYDADNSCMNSLSTVVICGSSLLMPILGQPAVSTRLAAWMTGHDEILHFHAFTAENLKGGLISLGIGALVYLLIVRRVMYRNGSYVNLWPEKLDLETAVYRPLIMQFLPNTVGRNISLFGENKVLTAVAKVVMFILSVIGRIMTDGTDAFILVLRKTIVREKSVRRPEDEKIGILDEAMEATHETAAAIMQNFSFALIMTCIGIMLILGGLLYMTVLH
ncbi:MAG: proton-conducting transporter membrane subunit [Lachnospiraceae bacterium]|nr:proton-conducting transporter membrane subunit [Lachnospiraceae bacterium]